MAKKRKNRKKSTNCNFDFDFPVELLNEILSRLPVKMLLKFRCVSKEWKSLIENPNFISMQINCQKDPQFFVLEGKIGSFNCLIRRNDTFRRISQLVKPNCTPCIEIRYCNGLILLNNSTVTISGFTLWNPSIRKAISIPPPPSSRDIGEVRVGLGFDSLTHDMKVVVLVCKENPFRDCPPPITRKDPFGIVIDVFSLKDFSWKSSRVTSLLVRSLRLVDETAFLNGSVHWIGCHVGMVPYPLYGSHVMGYNVENEGVRYFELPCFDGRVCKRFRVLAVFGEKLVFLDLFPGCSEIWVMEEYGVSDSWNRRYKFDIGFDRFLHFSRNGELLIMVNKVEIKKYDIESREIKDLAKSYRIPLFFIDGYVKSLVLVTQGCSLVEDSKKRPLQSCNHRKLE